MEETNVQKRHGARKETLIYVKIHGNEGISGDVTWRNRN